MGQGSPFWVAAPGYPLFGTAKLLLHPVLGPGMCCDKRFAFILHNERYSSVLPDFKVWPAPSRKFCSHFASVSKHYVGCIFNCLPPNFPSRIGVSFCKGNVKAQEAPSKFCVDERVEVLNVLLPLSSCHLLVMEAKSSHHTSSKCVLSALSRDLGT